MRYNVYNWRLVLVESGIGAQQGDRNVIALTFGGEIEAGGAWDLVVGFLGNQTEIPLTANDDGSLGCVLDNLPYAGDYNIQLRHTSGDEVKHTSVAKLHVCASLGGGQWDAEKHGGYVVVPRLLSDTGDYEDSDITIRVFSGSRLVATFVKPVGGSIFYNGTGISASYEGGSFGGITKLHVSADIATSVTYIDAFGGEHTDDVEEWTPDGDGYSLDVTDETIFLSEINSHI